MEFALVAWPFILVLLCTLQVAVYYMTQAALDSGVAKTGDNLRSGFNRATPTMPAAASLKSTVATSAGGLVQNDASLSVELRQMTTLALASTAITDGTADYGTATSVLVLRAQAPVTTFAPGFSALAQVTSSAIVRRQGR